MGFNPNLFEYVIRLNKFWLKPSFFARITFTALKGGAIHRNKFVIPTLAGISAICDEIPGLRFTTPGMTDNTKINLRVTKCTCVLVVKNINK